MMNVKLSFCAVMGYALIALASANDYKLVWSDEFNGKGLPDLNKWNYESGFVRNKEEQYYTVAREKNARLENGMLVIEAHKEKFPNPAYNPNFEKDWKKSRKFAKYTSACLTTFGRAHWKYGKILVRAKVPRGKGVWPAIWMLGDRRGKVRWPDCGEIDIMEYFGSRKPETVLFSIHCKKYYWVKKNSKNKRVKPVPAPYDAFHIYGIEWTPEKIDFLLDDKVVLTYKKEENAVNDSWPFDHSCYLLLNLALGGNAGGKIENSGFPKKFLIDYVRVYQKK
jgi:beta-glucanase (GH16 family)